MKTLLSLTLGFSLLAGSAAFIGSRQNAPTSQTGIPQATNAAYRDGLYQGRQSAERGFAHSAPVGRWSGSADREAFLAGYEQGYKTRAANAGNVWAVTKR